MSEFTSLLMDISKEIEKSELETMKCYCGDYGIGASRLEEITKAFELFKELRKRNRLGPDNKGILVELLEKADRIDLKTRVLQSEASSRVSNPTDSDAPDVDVVLRNAHLSDIAEDLGRDWKQLGRKLGISSGILDNIDVENRRVKEKAFQTMFRWKKRNGDNATVPALTKALDDIGRKDIAETLTGLCQQDGVNMQPNESQSTQHSHDQETSRTNSGLDTMQADLASRLPMQESTSS